MRMTPASLPSYASTGELIHRQGLFGDLNFSSP